MTYGAIALTEEEIQAAAAERLPSMNGKSRKVQLPSRNLVRPSGQACRPFLGASVSVMVTQDSQRVTVDSRRRGPEPWQSGRGGPGPRRPSRRWGWRRWWSCPAHRTSKTNHLPRPGGVGAGPARGASVAMPRGLIGLAITLGLTDTQRTAWDGEVTVSEGRVLGLDVARAGDATIDGGKFRVATKKQAANKKKAAAKKKKAQQKAAAAASAVIYVNLEGPETATVTVRTGQGTFSFKPADLKRGERSLFLDGQAAVERREAAVRLTGRGTEDDFPSAARAPDGTVWLAYVEYTPEVPHLTKAASKKSFDTLVPTKHGDRIRLRSFDGVTWSPGLDVTEAGLDVWRPAVAVDGRGEGLGRLGAAGRGRLGDLLPGVYPSGPRRDLGLVGRAEASHRRQGVGLPRRRRHRRQRTRLAGLAGVSSRQLRDPRARPPRAAGSAPAPGVGRLRQPG